MVTLLTNKESTHMRTIIAGGRDYQVTPNDYKRLDEVPFKITEVVSGCARGADQGGEAYATSRGIPIKRFPAQWDTFGKSAGYRRNVEMADYAEACVLFPGGKGTAHMRDIAVRKKLVLVDLT